MNILFCGDNNIADGIIISVLSLLKNVKEQLNVYILTMHFEDKANVCKALPFEFGQFLDRKVRLENKANSVEMFDVSDLFENNRPYANLKTRFTPCCMLRLYADLVPQLPEKILYLDNDVVCRMNCSEFYHQDISEYELAGVLDHYGKWFFRNSLFRMDYINSGVLLLNLSKIRKTGLFEKCRKLCAEKKMFMPDQSAINMSAKRKTAPRRYNEQRKLHDDTVLQHFTTSFRFFPLLHTVTVKPWHTEKMHEVLKIYEYDDLLDEYIMLKREFDQSLNKEKGTLE